METELKYKFKWFGKGKDLVEYMENRVCFKDEFMEGAESIDLLVVTAEGRKKLLAKVNSFNKDNKKKIKNLCNKRIKQLKKLIEQYKAHKDVKEYYERIKGGFEQFIEGIK